MKIIDELLAKVEKSGKIISLELDKEDNLDFKVTFAIDTKGINVLLALLGEEVYKENLVGDWTIDSIIDKQPISRAFFNEIKEYMLEIYDNGDEDEITEDIKNIDYEEGYTVLKHIETLWRIYDGYQSIQTTLELKSIGEGKVTFLYRYGD